MKSSGDISGKWNRKKEDASEMEYLVMSCNLSHAVVADEAGRFFKVPNLNYEVGQVLRDVVILSESPVRKTSAGRILRFAALAACLCLALLGGILWQKPVGTVQLHLNPGVRLRVNRFNRVVSSAGTGTEGEALLRGYHAYGQTVQKVSDGLADRAVEMGYLTEGEQITVRVESNQISWKTALENLLRTELDEHLEQRFTVVVDNDDPDDDDPDDDDPDDDDPDDDDPDDDDPDDDDPDDDDPDDDEPDDDDPDDDEPDDDDPDDDEPDDDDPDGDDPDDDDPDDDEPDDDDPDDDEPDDDSDGHTPGKKS